MTAVEGGARQQTCKPMRAASLMPLSCALEHNDKFFQQEREKLDAWAVC